MLGYCLEIVALNKYAHWCIRTQRTNMRLQYHKAQELKMSLKIRWLTCLPGNMSGGGHSDMFGHQWQGAL